MGTGDYVRTKYGISKIVPDGVETITTTKEDYDRNVEQMFFEKIQAELEVKRLNNIINELEKYCNIYIGMNFNMNNSRLQEQIVEDYTNILDKLKELKENNNGK